MKVMSGLDGFRLLAVSKRDGDLNQAIETLAATALPLRRMRPRYLCVMLRGSPKVANRLLSPNLVSDDTRAPATDTTMSPLAR